MIESVLKVEWNDEREALSVLGAELEPQIRWLKRVREFVQHPVKGIDFTPQYYMHRAVARPGDEWKELRYDLTVLPPRPLGKEYNKTIGHYHPPAPCGKSYPEAYEVLSGEAHYLLQKKDLTRFILVKAREGDKVMVPPDYGHVTVNPSKEKALVMSNIAEATFKSEYGDYEGKKGAAYYEFEGGLEKNPLYGEVPEPEIVGARKFDEFKGKELYLWGAEEKEALSFLARPEEFKINSVDA